MALDPDLWPKALDYLARLGMVSSGIERVSLILDFASEICPEPITDIFVSERNSESGGKIPDSLWYFSESYAGEARDYLSQDTTDLIYIRNTITYWKVVRRKYSPHTFDQHSRMALTFTSHPFGGELSAVGQNCDALMGIMKRHIVPNTPTPSTLPQGGNK